MEGGPIITQFPMYAPQSQVMSRRPKLTDNIKLIEKVMKRQNQTQQESRGNHQTPLIPPDIFDRSEGKKLVQANANHSMLIGRQQSILSAMEENLTTSSNSVQGHYMNDKIDKTIQKYQKKQIIKNNSPFMNSNGNVRSRNFNQSNSASKIYCATFKGISSKNQSPYLNNGGIYQAQQSLNEKDHAQMFEESDVRNFEMSDDKRFIDLSFESLNPINNSFTEGIKESRSTGGNRSQINGQGPASQVQIKLQFQKMGKPPKFVDSFQPPSLQQDYLLKSNFEDSGSLDRIQLLQPPNVSWWSQQMYPQPLIAPGTAHISGTGNIFDAHSLYQLPLYPSSVHASPFQQSKSREGGYRNIPIRDMSSISDQSPNKPAYTTNNDAHPFKGPKLHLFKKGNSRRIKTSSAARNLQPIYPLDSSKVIQNFNSINAGGTILNENDSNYQSHSKQNKLDFDQQNQYTTLTNTNQQSSIYQSANKRLGNELNGTIDVYDGDQNYGNYSNSTRNLVKNNGQMRPNTTSLDQLESQESPKRHLYNLTNLNQQKKQGLSKVELQEEINGFKHSFYNDKSAQTPTNKQKQEKQTENIDSARQIEKLKEQIHQNSEVIKHIFVLNVGANNMGTNQQSTQESKAMTPCFIHTPNMTNKWGNFKPDGPERTIVQEEEEHFIKDNIKIKGIQQTKKPQTSHQSKNQQINGQLKQRQRDNNSESIKLSPEDIYLANGSKSHKNNTSQAPKPQTSASLRLPLSRNQGMDHITRKNVQNFTIANHDNKQNSKKAGTGILKVKLSNFTKSQNGKPQTGGKSLIKEQPEEDEEIVTCQNRDPQQQES